MKADRPATFAEIYPAHHGLLRRVTRTFALDPADQDDLLQDMLVALWQALPQFQAQAKLTTFVYRVALNVAINWKRSRRRYQDKVERYRRSFAVAEAGTAGNGERTTWLYRQIHQLPEVDRALVLLYLDDVPYREIGDIIGLSESNVGVRLHRIKHQMAKAAPELAS